jgi:archaellum component FlaG (FlaF/FlaG flagellin family)
VSISNNVLAEQYVFGTNIRINDDSGNKPQRTPEIAVTDNGDIYVVWGDERNGDSDIFISKSTDGGNLFGDQTQDTDIKVDNDLGTASQRDPAIDTYGNKIYVVWMDDRPGFYHIYFSKSTDNGETFSGNIKVDNLLNSVVCEYPDIAVSPVNGKISVVWQALDKIYYSESTDGGSTFIPSVLVDSSAPSGIMQKYPKIAIGSEGDKYITWQDNRSGGLNYDIYFATASSASTSFGGVIRVDEGSGTTETWRPAIASYGTSNVYITWKDERNGPSGDIFFDKSTNKGSSWGTDKHVDDQSPGSKIQDKPSIAVDNSGKIHITWEDKRTPNYQIYYANSSDGGSSFNANIHVDDSQQNIECNEPSIITNGANKVYVVWKDKRNQNFDIFFSRWGIKGQMGYSPTLSEPKISPQVGGKGDKFKWEVIYTDLDNDAPALGYPKVHIYTDHSGTIELPGSPFDMLPKAFQDGLYTNGEIYSISKTLNEDYDYAYKFEAQASAGDTSVVKTKLKLGPIIDVTPPIFSNPTPKSNKWQNTQSVECSITISDQGGSGVDNTRIKYQYMTNGSSEFSRYYTNAKVVSIADGFTCSATITFQEGAENYVRWNATDLVQSGEGYSLSESYEVKIDTTGPSFTNPVPLDIHWQNKESVTCSITVNDLASSGVNGSSILYYYKPSGTALYIGPFSAAMAETGESIKVTTPEPVPFYNGEENYIKWTAKDLSDNIGISTEFQVRIDTNRRDNTPPSSPRELKPTDTSDNTPQINWRESTDADKDKLEYFIQIGTYIDGSDVLPWTSTDTFNFYIVKSPLLVGTYYVQIKAYDDLDYSPTLQSMMNITATSINRPPTAPNSITPNLSPSQQPTISWSGAFDADNDTLMYFIQIGKNPNGAEILEWTPVGKNEYYTAPVTFDYGVYYIQLMSYDGEATSEPHSEMIKIAVFFPEMEMNRKLTVTQGDISTSLEIKITNDGTMSDNITLNITGDLTEKSTVTFTHKPSTPIQIEPGENKTITITIGLPALILRGDHTFKVEAMSEDGDTTTGTRTITLTVNPKKPNNGTPNGNGDGTTESESFLGGLLPMIILLIVVVVIIAVVAGVLVRSRKRKMDEKDKDDFFRRKDDYEKLYGPKKEY